MGRKKSNYKKKEYNWWDSESYSGYGGRGGYYDDDYIDASAREDYGYSSPYSSPMTPSTYGGGYGYSRWYKPKFDMSVSLGTRVTQLIKTITGKNLKLVQASGWGNDDEYFYYRAEDLENATDDEILGRILHQLAREISINKPVVTAQNKTEPSYRQLLDTLEDSRADNLLQVRYEGCKYYAAELWENRKFRDNPINKYPEDLKSEDLKVPKEEYIENKNYYDEYVKKTNEAYKQQRIPALEFCFNISALQNGEKEFDFYEEKTLENFQKAAPFIQQYLSAPTYEEAQRVYPDIKKYYPIPDSQQQKEMDKQMDQAMGMTSAQMDSYRKQQKRIEKAEVEGEPVEEFLREFADNDEEGYWNKDEELGTFKEYLAKHAGTAGALFALIRSILKDNSVRRFTRPYKRGKLDAKRIYKYLATDNLRIFKKPKAISQQNYPMTIVVDMSGSMRGRNSKYATEGVIVLSNVMERLGFPYEIIAYNGTVYSVKKFSEPLRPEILPSLEKANGDNNELSTVKLLTNRLKSFDPSNEFHKGVFWITDGEAYSPDEVKVQVSELEKNHNTTVFAIGIGGVRQEALDRCYNHVVKVDNVTELPKQLVDLMRGQFRRG
jgi:uncharacterized protein with von Willebrand factor type A (vWA) domain